MQPRMWTIIGLLTATWCGSALAAPATAPATTQAAAPRTYALLVGGNTGSAVYARRYADWLTRFHAYITAPGRAAKADVVVLAGDPGSKSPIVNGASTAENVKRALADFAAKVRPGDQFVLFAVGHGAVAETVPTLIVPGPDLTAPELTEGLNAIPSKNQVVLLMTSGAGDLIKPLAKANRAIVSATSTGDAAEPVFCEFFLLALETKAADGEAPLPLPATTQSTTQPEPDPAHPTWRTGAKDGVVSVLEAYNWATHETAMWTMRQKQEGSEWAVEGKRSAELFRKLCVGDDKDPGARKLAGNRDGSQPDAVIRLKMKAGEKPDGWWVGRRSLAEHALLEDCGAEVGVTALRGIGYEPLDGARAGEPGQFARRVIIGQPTLLQNEGPK